MPKRSSKPFVGVDLGGTNIQVGVVDDRNKVLSREKSKTKPDDGSKAVVERIAQAVHDAVKQAGLKPRQLGGLGIGAPGAIDTTRGLVLDAPNLRWNKFPLGKALRDQLKMPVTVDNDVNVAVWGEYQAGTAEDHDDLLGIWIGTGVGGGLVLDGKLYDGHYHTAGEIGHTLIHADAPLGRRTLENCASRTSITHLLAQLILANHPSKLTELLDGDLGDMRSKVIAKALVMDDPLTIQVVRQAAKYVGIAAANVVSVMSLPCVVLGGGFTTALGKPWVEWVRISFESAVFPAELRKCKVVPGRLGDDAGIIGAAVLARQRLK